MGHLKVLKFLKNQKNIDWTVHDQEPLLWAAENHHIPILKWMLSIPEINFSVKENLVLNSAKDIEINDIRTLMSCFIKKADLGADNNLAARLAGRQGHLAVLEFLNEKPNVDFAANDNEIVKIAIQTEYTPIIRYIAEWAVEDASRLNTLMILFEEGVDYAHLYSDLPFIAVQYQQLPVLKFLEGKPGIRFNGANNIAFSLACGLGNLDIVQFLANLKDPLNRPIILPFARDHDAVIMAASNGHLEILKYLSTLPFVDFHDQGNKAAYMAASNGHVHVLKFLESMPGVDFSDSSNAAVRFASENGHVEVLEFLDGKSGIDFGV